MDALKQLHKSIAGTFEECFDTTYKELNAELAAYNARANDAEARAQAADEALRELMSETGELRHEVNLLRAKTYPNENDWTDDRSTTESLELDEIFEPSRVLGDINACNLSAERFQKISERYLELYGQAGMFLEASVALRRQVKSHKRKLERLQSFFHRQEFTFTLNEQVVKFRRVEQRSTQTTISPRVTERRADAEIPTQLLAAPKSKEGSSTGAEQEDSGERQMSGQDPIPSDASTVELPPARLAAPSTQWSGTLKRRHPGDQPALKYGSSSESANKGGRGHPIIVKSEAMSSSPIMAYSSHPGPPGTQDLDDIGDTVVTPTKRVRYRKDPNFRSYRDGSQTTKESSSAPRIARQTRMDERVMSGVLQPVDSNLRNPSRLYQTANKGRKREAGSATRISAVTEDGDENHPPALAKKAGTGAPDNSPYVWHPSTGHRLINLLEQPSPSSISLQPKPAIGKSTRKLTRSPEKGSSAACRSESDITSTTTPITSESSRGSPMPRVRQRLPESASEMGITPEDEPYRARPLDRLALDHFRINPDHNQGLDFAYDEVLRKKDERKCVSGCTRPGCCGDKFLAMARFGISTAVSGREISDQKILEDFLGGSGHSISDLSSEERRTFLEQAKAKQLSDRFGRHRHQHHRSGTPPGFWRTDMPGTQELEEDREQAHRLEREKVEERYREAMRPGGRWMFADE
ncbi:DNA repair protein endonuclease SAE2/CtIP C-terminus-domain-containing protein [Aspergillus pseudoustus]|uniref:DNA repair protein endonuclease SAE2/CtIP C-terminus-domain-containing protein n=1 Tax=Aspergillus pseudoustus TaxID=1810923 RepID=A0ABR4J9V0_9EURO